MGQFLAYIGQLIFNDFEHRRHQFTAISDFAQEFRADHAAIRLLEWSPACVVCAVAQLGKARNIQSVAAPDFTVQLAGLKERLMYGNDFCATAHYFQDHLGDNDLFTSKKVCHRAKAEKLEMLLRKALEVFFKQDRPRVSGAIILRARGTPFYHGAFQAGDHCCVFFYFDDIAMGLLTLVAPNDPQVHSIRLTAQLIGEGPIWN
jgi:hypothetical protein